MKPLVYLAGPYSIPDPVQNTHRMIRFATGIIEDGKVTPVLPHLTMLWHLVTPRPIEFWYAYDLELLAHCDYVLRYLGWSDGAEKEVRAAKELGIPVFYELADLYRHLDGGENDA